MMQTSLKAFTVVALICVGMLSLPSPAKAGWGCGWGCGWGPGLVGFGVGALVGSALVALRVYAGPPRSMAPLPMDRQPDRPLGTLIAPSATVVSTRIRVTLSDLTAIRISVDSLSGFFSGAQCPNC